MGRLRRRHRGDVQKDEHSRRALASHPSGPQTLRPSESPGDHRRRIKTSLGLAREKSYPNGNRSIGKSLEENEKETLKTRSEQN